MIKNEVFGKNGKIFAFVIRFYLPSLIDGEKVERKKQLSICVFNLVNNSGEFFFAWKWEGFEGWEKSFR